MVGLGLARLCQAWGAAPCCGGRGSPWGGWVAVLAGGGHSQGQVVDPASAVCWCFFCSLFGFGFPFGWEKRGTQTALLFPHERLNSYSLVSCAVLKPLDCGHLGLEAFLLVPLKVLEIMVKVGERKHVLYSPVRPQMLEACFLQSSLQGNLYTFWNAFWIKFFPQPAQV